MSSETALTSFQFIGFPSEWGEGVATVGSKKTRSFQFIGFPSEWGAGRGIGTGLAQHHPVSNLLGSPASGEEGNSLTAEQLDYCFQFIGFPSEWGVIGG